jgi:hypothetical protein
MGAMSELEESVQQAIERGGDARLNSLVAILVAAAATFMALCNVKDGNIVQAMSQAQSHAVDAWSYYQAKGTKENLVAENAEALAVARDTARDLSPEARATYDRKIEEYKTRAALYASEKQRIKSDAEGFEREYDRLNVHDDQFDAAEACLTVSIALFSVTALTRRRWLLGLGLAMLGFGAIFGLSGFFGLGFHPDFLSRVLG